METTSRDCPGCLAGSVAPLLFPFWGVTGALGSGGVMWHVTCLVTSLEAH